MRSRSRNISTAAPVAVGDQAGNGSALGRDGAEAPGGGLGRPAGQADGNGAGHAEVPQARPAPRRALKNWRVRSRLLLLITIPTLTAVALGGIRIASSVQSALAYQRVLQLTTLSSDITVLAQRLEDERDQTVYYISLGNAGGRSASTSAGKAVALDVVNGYQAQTNQAVGQVRAQLQDVGGSFPAQTQQEATTALSELNLLGELRAAATGTDLPALDVVRKYTGLIDDLLVLEDATGQGASDATLAQSVRVLGLVSHMKEDASEQRAILTAALIQHNLTTEALGDLTSAESDQAANLGEFNLTATAAQRQLWNSTGTGPNAYLAPNEESQAIAAAQANSGSLASDQTHGGRLVRRGDAHHQLPDGRRRAKPGRPDHRARVVAAEPGGHHRHHHRRGHPLRPGPGPVLHRHRRPVDGAAVAAVACGGVGSGGDAVAGDGAADE